jgi:hypothetical protein
VSRPPNLRVITAPTPAAAPEGETLAERIQRLQAEARGYAKDHIAGVREQMDFLAAQAGAIATGGDAYPAGVRDLMRRMVEDLESRAQTLDAVTTRSGL